MGAHFFQISATSHWRPALLAHCYPLAHLAWAPTQQYQSKLILWYLPVIWQVKSAPKSYQLLQRLSSLAAPLLFPMRSLVACSGEKFLGTYASRITASKMSWTILVVSINIRYYNCKQAFNGSNLHIFRFFLNRNDFEVDYFLELFGAAPDSFWLDSSKADIMNSLIFVSVN